jgi:hypothetical protein
MNMHSAVTRSLATALLIFGSFVFTAAQPESIYRLPAGTRIKLKLDAEINSKVSTVNDTFIASISQPVLVRDAIVLPVGTVIEGRVTGARAASPGGKGGRLDLAFVTLELSNDQRRSIDGILVGRPDSGSISTMKVLTILGGTAIGAVFGGLARTGNGALLGAGIGAGVGTAIALSQKGKDVSIGKNVEFEIELRKEVVLPVLDY